MTKRTARITYDDGFRLELPITKMVTVNTQKRSLALNELKDGTGYSLALHPEFVRANGRIESIQIIRKD